jgi:MFS family permease
MVEQSRSTATAADDRPTRPLPLPQLIRLSLYWLGLSSIFAGLSQIMQGRIQFGHLVPAGEEGRALFSINIVGSIVAIAVQPTIGSISDYTQTRWGRRKPYILIGSILDVVFLAALASSNTLFAIAVFIVLLQFSSNFAQGPFQGYVPDLVPASQVGLASALVGLMQVLGNIAGFGIAAVAVATNQFGLGLIALGALELATMLSVVIRVDDGKTVKDRGGRSWLDIARSAWGTDILRERSYMWLVASRLFILIAGALLTNHVVFYLAQSQGLKQSDTLGPQLVMLGVVAAGNVVSVIPAARISDRIGRKPVIYASCVLGAIGVAIVAIAPNIPIAIAGAGFFGVAAGMFLAVDWALMTDIIPKASSGRYMGISNLATGSAGTLAQMFGGAVTMDAVNHAFGYGTGPRATMAVGVLAYAIGALLLRPVVERRRDSAARTVEVPAAAV